MKEISLTNSSKKALIDDEDYDRVILHNWCIRGEIQGNISRVAPPYVALTSYIKDTDKMYDHKDRDPFNNQKSNLREATSSQNMMNRAKFNFSIRKPTSKYKGVSYDDVKLEKKWRVVIYYNNGIRRVKVHIGYYFTEESAARAYDNAAIRYHGEFAVLNFPKE